MVHITYVYRYNVISNDRLFFKMAHWDSEIGEDKKWNISWIGQQKIVLAALWFGSYHRFWRPSQYRHLPPLKW